jgi:acetylornithine deacetylase/succinyl-diaminopimelate desuccinylase-like protein
MCYLAPMRFIAVLLALIPMYAEQPHEAARRWRESRERAIIDEYIALLSLPNVARNLDDMRRNAAHIRTMLERRGVHTELLEVPYSPAVIYGEILTPGATQTLVFYAHYDGQPVEPAEWKDSGPFQPVLRDKALHAGGKVIPLPAPGQPFNPEWRLYARSAGDDKAPIITILTALDALKAAKIPLRSNIKLFLDGEEEAGSPHLAAIIDKYKQKLSADAWIFCDGPVHQTRKQQVVFGVRGSTTLNITVYGPNRELHSGHYGNWAPNPASMLARLVSSLRDDEGRILVPGFYDDVEPLSEIEKNALAAVPDIDRELRQELGLARAEGNGLRLETLITLPALNIRGLSSAGVGSQSRNVVPSTASASIDIRLVKGMDHRRAVDKLIAHIKQQGYQVVEQEPDDAMRLRYPKICRITRGGGYNAIRAPMDSAIAQKVIRAVREARTEVILLPNMGGSLPIAPIADALQRPVIILPIANHDNNQHAHNENMRLQNLWDGIETMAALLTIQ